MTRFSKPLLNEDDDDKTNTRIVINDSDYAKLSHIFLWWQWQWQCLKTKNFNINYNDKYFNFSIVISMMIVRFQNPKLQWWWQLRDKISKLVNDKLMTMTSTIKTTEYHRWLSITGDLVLMSDTLHYYMTWYIIW